MLIILYKFLIFIFYLPYIVLIFLRKLIKKEHPHKYKEKILYLAKKDKDLINLFKSHKNFGEYSRNKGFKGLLQLIIEQQLSVASAKAIYKKMNLKLKSISPEALLNTSDLDLKECGLSKQKISYLKIKYIELYK